MASLFGQYWYSDPIDARARSSMRFAVPGEDPRGGREDPLAAHLQGSLRGWSRFPGTASLLQGELLRRKRL